MKYYRQSQKKNKIVLFVCLTSILVFLILISITSENNYKYITEKDVINLNTSLLNNVYIEQKEEIDNIEKINNDDEKQEKNTRKKEVVNNNQNQVRPASTVVDNNPQQNDNQPMDSVYVGLKFTGSMTAYGRDCCGSDPSRWGITSSGYDLKQSLTYNDPTYGSVRIVASDKNFKLYSIIQINDPIDGSYNAIVLDRAGSVIGLNKTKKFDLAVESESYASSNYGVHKNVTFQVLRVGK